MAACEDCLHARRASVLDGGAPSLAYACGRPSLVTFEEDDGFAPPSTLRSIAAAAIPGLVQISLGDVYLYSEEDLRALFASIGGAECTSYVYRRPAIAPCSHAPTGRATTARLAPTARRASRGLPPA